MSLKVNNSLVTVRFVLYSRYSLIDLITKTILPAKSKRYATTFNVRVNTLNFNILSRWQSAQTIICSDVDNQCFVFADIIVLSSKLTVADKILRLINKYNSQPLGKILSFLEDPKTFEGRGGPGGLGGSEKHIWKIFYRGDPEIGTPGTPLGSQGTKIFFLKNFLLKSYQGICRQVQGSLW